MLKDKKIIIHKTDGKTFVPITGRSYRTNSSYGFCLSFQFLSLYAILAAILSSVKLGKQTYFLRERCDLTFPLLFPPVHGPSGEDGQKAAGRICSLLPGSSCVIDKHRFKHLIKCGNTQTKKRPVLFHTICTLRWIFQNNTHFSGQNPPHITWLVSNHPKLV